MSERTRPRYPIYVPSKNRWQEGRASTLKILLREGIPFHAVVEPQEEAEYVELLGAEHVLVLPFSDLGQGSIPARNWIMDHAIESGAKRHWQLDDNIREFRRLWKGKRFPTTVDVALRVVEDFSDRYENVGISGLNYQCFVTESTSVPYYLNVHVYSCTLIDNAIPYRWRGRYNEDTDMCLQVLAGGLCTVLVNVYMANKAPTMKVAGGNTDMLYADEGRHDMAYELARRWPKVVRVDRRWGRPQHVVNWKKFDTPLKRRADVDFGAPGGRDEYGLRFQAVREVKSPVLQQMLVEEAQ